MNVEKGKDKFLITHDTIRSVKMYKLLLVRFRCRLCCVSVIMRPCSFL